MLAFWFLARWFVVAMVFFWGFKVFFEDATSLRDVLQKLPTPAQLKREIEGTTKKPAAVTTPNQEVIQPEKSQTTVPPKPQPRIPEETIQKIMRAQGREP